MKYIMSAMLLAGAAIAAVNVSAAGLFQNPEFAGHQQRIEAMRKRHEALKPATPEQKAKHEEFRKRFDAHIADLAKADKIADAAARKIEAERIGKEIEKTEKEFAGFEGGLKIGIVKEPRHDGFIARLKELRKRHVALKPMKPEDAAKHAEFIKRFDAHEADLAKAAKIEKAEERRKEYDRIEKELNATDKEFGVFEKRVHGA